MKPWEQFLLAFIQASAPSVETLFIHNAKSVAVFNASDELFNGVVQALTPQNVPAPPPPPPATK